MHNMLGWELLEEYKKGKRIFSDMHMEFSDLTSANLEGVTIKDSKLNFVLLRMSNLKNCKFVNCEMFCCGFRDADFTNTAFENCKIDYGYFSGSVFDSTKIIKCKLSFCAMFSTTQPDMSTSELFKVFTDASQVTQEDMDAAFNGLMPFVDTLGIEPSKTSQIAYGEKDAKYAKPLSVYAMMEQMISTYAAKNPYNTKTPYEKSGKNAYKTS